MDTLKKVCLVLIIIGAINWAFVGLFNIDLVASLFGGSDNIIAKIIYIIIGIVALVLIIIIGWWISTSNNFRRTEVKINEAESGIDVALTKRYTYKDARYYSCICKARNRCNSRHNRKTPDEFYAGPLTVQ